MNLTEHRLNIAHQLEELSEESLCELEKIIAQLKSKPKQKPKRQAGCMKGLVAYIAEDFNRVYGMKYLLDTHALIWFFFIFYRQ